MPDHWKSLANKLGAPGVDLPEESEGTKSVVKQKPEQPLPELKDASKERESWDEDAMQEDEPSDSSHEVAAEDAFEELTAGTARGVESREPAESIQAAPQGNLETESSMVDPPKKGKRKSSWEALAQMFNIKVDRAEEKTRNVEAQEPDPGAASDENLRDRVVEPAADRDEGLGGEPSRSIFGDEISSADSSNPALRAMFGEAPRATSDDWHKNRRVVDDVGWEDELDEPEGDDGARDAPPKDAVAFEDDVDETPQPTRRRGRRGRGRGERTPKPAFEPDAEDAWGETAFESSADVWAEPERLEEEIEDDGEGAEEAERRSSRRRRRGRRSSREREEIARSELPPERRPAAESDETEAELRPRRKRKPVESLDESPRKSRGPIDDAEDEDAEAPKHRNIPTWEEALQTIVESNSLNHKKNEHRGGNRGRSRGRR